MVRIFTPIREKPFAGHPNVGTAFVLATQMADRNEPVPRQFVFEEEAGLVAVTLMQKEGIVLGAELAAPEPVSHGARRFLRIARQSVFPWPRKTYAFDTTSRRLLSVDCRFFGGTRTMSGLSARLR